MGVAIVGLGRIGHVHAVSAVTNMEFCELVAVIDQNAALADSFSKEFGVRRYLDIDEALRDADIDAVVICLPHNLHHSICIKSIEAGKHVLVEKVMATSVRDAISMIKAAERGRRNLMVGQCRRFFSPIRKARELLPRIGSITSILYTLSTRFNVATAPPWWRSLESTGGLVYPMLGAHSIDLCLWMQGNTTPVSVYASGRNSNRGFEGHDCASLIINFADGTHATNFLSINTLNGPHEMLISGTDGSIRFLHGEYSGVGNQTTKLFFGGAEVDVGPMPDPFDLQMSEFARSILRDRAPVPSGKDVLMQIAIIEAARRSAERREVVDLPALEEMLR